VKKLEKVDEMPLESQIMFEGLFEAAPDAIVLADGEGRILRVNQQAELMFGYSRGELHGKPIEALLPPRFRERHVARRSTYLAEPRLRSMGAGLELYGLRKDGSEFPVDIVLSPLQTGGQLFVVSVIRDITERKEMEAELAEVQRRLTDSREAERLHLAQELHDGPIQDLYAISYRLAELAPVLSDGDGQEQMAAVQATLQQVLRTLRAISVELRPPTLAPFGLEKAIRSHVEEFQKAHPELTIQLDLMPDGQALPEPVRLTLFRIYQQALNNVARHAEASLVTIRLKLDTQQVTLEIQDNGHGFRVPSRRITLVRQGHLGLAGIAERAESIGGRLDIVSAPGEGTLVRVAVPRLSEKQPAAPDQPGEYGGGKS
jgi:PAS domain S-box-containing protein